MNTLLDSKSWHYRQLNETTPGLETLSDGLIKLRKQGYPIMACTADLQYSNGLSKYAKIYPDSFLQFGISEQNMVSASAGMATLGAMPFVATFASFLALLCCEQIRTDIAYSALPVRLIGHHAGISLGFYGTSHHATEDLAIMRSIADLTVVAPADNTQLYAAILASVNHQQPIYFRIGRGRDIDVYQKPLPFTFGKAITHYQGSDLTIIACGSMVQASLAAAKTLQLQGFSVGFIDMHTIKPIDKEIILNTATHTKIILSVEEHNVLGGLGSAISEVLTDNGCGVSLKRHGINDLYSKIAPPSHLYAHYQLDQIGIIEKARQILTDKK
ncbi:MAG: transketolase family protein [Ostreibacterium sp.]